MRISPYMVRSSETGRSYVKEEMSFWGCKRPFLETEDAAERVEHHVVRKRFHCVFLERGDGLRVLFTKSSDMANHKGILAMSQVK